MDGAQAEAAAQRLLERAGLRPLARNYRCKGGELDLVMLDQTVLVVAEVRVRSHRGFGSAAESIDARKQQRIIRATQLFLAAHPQHADRPLRFDVVTFDGGGAPQWLRGAFDAG